MRALGSTSLYTELVPVVANSSGAGSLPVQSRFGWTLIDVPAGGGARQARCLSHNWLNFGLWPAGQAACLGGFCGENRDRESITCFGDGSVTVLGDIQSGFLDYRDFESTQKLLAPTGLDVCVQRVGAPEPSETTTTIR